MIVVDSNVIAYFFIPCQFTAAAQALRTEHPQWIAPALWRSELRNILLKHVNAKMFTLADAIDIDAAAQKLMGMQDPAIDSETVLTLASQSACTAYDCEFIALAQELGVPLVSQDKKLVKAFPGVAKLLVAAELTP